MCPMFKVMQGLKLILNTLKSQIRAVLPITDLHIYLLEMIGIFIFYVAIFRQHEVRLLDCSPPGGDRSGRE